MDLIPGQGTKITHAMRHSQKKKKKEEERKKDGEHQEYLTVQPMEKLSYDFPGMSLIH